MIISRTPFRISFFGGGTDFPKWYKKHGGAILSTSIDKYCYITCRHLPKFFTHKNRIVWSKIENVNSPDEITHPVVREVLKWKQMTNLSIAHDGDLPSRCGLGSSSSFTVGLLNSIYRMKGEKVTKNKLINDAIYLEHKLLKEAGGIQDQIAVTKGNLNNIQITPDGTFKINEIDISIQKKNMLESRLMMFYTGISRYSSSISSSTIDQIYSHEDKYHSLFNMVGRANKILNGDNNLDDFGELLNEYWEIKKQLSPLISSPFIDNIYTAGMNAGALGGKILGAGGGGFILFYVKEGKQDKVKKALNDLLHVNFKFETGGSEIIYDNINK